MFGCCFTISSDFLWKFSMKIWPKSRNLGWKQRKFQQNRRCFRSRNSETDAGHVTCACGLRNCVYASWIFTGLSLGGDLGEKVSLSWLTSPYFELREKFKFVEHNYREIQNLDKNFSPKSWKCRKTSPCLKALGWLLYLMSSKAGNPAKDFWRTNAPTVGPGIKSTGAYSMLKVKLIKHELLTPSIWWVIIPPAFMPRGI